MLGFVIHNATLRSVITWEFRVAIDRYNIILEMSFWWHQSDINERQYMWHQNGLVAPEIGATRFIIENRLYCR